ncbi:MAG: DUF2283 domain-containing protein [Bacteriovorax sp.]
MAKINLIHDNIGKTLTIHFGDPRTEYASELTDDDIIVMKDKSGKVIGLEILHFDNDPDEEISLKVIPNLA